MKIIEANLHPKVLKNQLFIKAVDWLIDNGCVANQKELAAITKIQEPTLSNIRNDRKVVSDKTIRKLLDAFPGIFNPEYFRGQNIHMTMAELIEANYEADKLAKSEPSADIPDMSSVFNSALAKADETIESLKRELLTKDDLIHSLRDQLAIKDQLIAEQKARLIDYRRIIDSKDEFSNYPFPIGAAEGDKRQRKSK